MTGKNRIMIYGPKTDGTYVVRETDKHHARWQVEAVRPLFGDELLSGRVVWVISETPGNGSLGYVHGGTPCRILPCKECQHCR